MNFEQVCENQSYEIPYLQCGQTSGLLMFDEKLKNVHNKEITEHDQGSQKKIKLQKNSWVQHFEMYYTASCIEGKT